MSGSNIAKDFLLPLGSQPCTCPASSSYKVFLIIKEGDTSSPVMSFIGKERDSVGPSIMTEAVSAVDILIRKLPVVLELTIIPISSLMVVPAGILTALYTVYVKVELDGADNQPEPMPVLSILLAAETSKPDGKVILIVFIVPVVAVLNMMSYVDLVFTMLLEGTIATLVSAPTAIAGLINGKKDDAIVNTTTIRSKLSKVLNVLSDAVLLFDSKSLNLILFNGTIDPL